MSGTAGDFGFLANAREAEENIGNPDPIMPAFLHRALPGLATRGRRWTIYQERRSTILAAARKAVVREIGVIPGLRAIADIADVSVPTIYNLVGNRERLMQEAGAEWCQWLGFAATADAEGADVVLSTIEAYWNSAINFHDFTEMVVRAATPSQSWLNIAALDTGTEILQRQLRELHDQGLLRRSLDVDRFAFHLAQTVHFGIRHWMLDTYDADTYRRDFANGPALMLLGAVVGSESARIDHRIAAIADGIAAPARIRNRTN